MHLDHSALSQMDAKWRIKLVNSLVGGKPVHLVGTASAEGVPNLAVFNSACHVSSEPARIGIMSRPLTVSRDTYANIKATGVWTLNAIQENWLEQAHKAADKLPSADSEFDHTGLDEHWWPGFAAPAVAQSPVRIGLKLVEELPIQCSGTVMLIGELQHLSVASELLLPDGSLDVGRAGCLSSLGLDAYAQVREAARFEYRSQRR